MKTIDAYRAIIHDVESNPKAELLSSSYDEELFGNFVISIVFSGKGCSIVSDRGQLFLCNDINGRGDCDLIASSLAVMGTEDLSIFISSINVE